MSSPFDDPEVQAAMARAGIVHKPGLAAEMMDELAPLLAAEGIDLNDPETHTDPEALNAALGRAAERYNLELFTPVGERRDQALAVLTEFARVVTRKRPHEAENLLDSIGPDASGDRPAASHLIGASLGLLDDWYTDAAISATLRDVPVPKWRGPARSGAERLIHAARRGGAYASLHELTVRHGGRFVMHAAVLAVAATILASASRAGENVAAAAHRLYSHQPAPAPAGGSAFGMGAAGMTDLARRFEEWLTAEDASAAGSGLGELLDRLGAMARERGLDLEVPGDVAEMLEQAGEFDDEELRELVLDLLHDYVYFQQETGTDPAGWDEVHAAVAAEEDAGDPLLSVLAETIEQAQQLPPAERRAGLARLSIVAGVAPLLDWLDRPRPITPGRGLRLADIEPVAGMIGLSAVGVRQRSTAEPFDPRLEVGAAEAPAAPVSETIRARSIMDVPVLHAWWHALEAAGLIELTATRVRRVGSVEADGLPDRQTMEVLVPYFLADLLLRQLERGVDGIGLPTLLMVVNRLAAALAPDEYALGGVPSDVADLVGPAADRQIEMLRQAGFIEVDAGGVEAVPEPVRGAVAVGIAGVLSAVVGEGED